MDTITVRQLIEIINSPEDNSDSIKEALISALHILRSFDQKEPATDEGTLDSFNSWVIIYGAPTKEKVYQWLEALGERADMPLQTEFVFNTLGTDLSL